MKKTLTIALLFLFACHAREDMTIAFLNEGIEACNQNINNDNNGYYTDAKVSLMQNPAKAQAYRANLILLKIKTGNILIAIKHLQDKISPNKGSEKEDNTEIFLSMEGNSGKTDLSSSISDYKQLVDSLFHGDTVPMKNFEDNLNINHSPLKNYGIAELNLLNNIIQNSNSFILEYYIRKMENPRFRANKLEIAVVPKERYLHLNDLYKAELYLIAYDTAANISIKIEEQNIKTHRGKAQFTDAGSDLPWNIYKNGLLTYIDNFNNYPYQFPFTIKYHINQR
jgi:hypothetical protein